MACILEGYNYDIFISYRQKDNKHDGWVTEFVNNLKGELESTFKEEISVYFDINPHDGLLETHDVDASLKEKLKCIVFIPIISRTYCDPKSFAWEHEFKAFVEQACQDKIGLKVKLPNGNVASRVLPIRIHDLDNDDIKLCESILGGVLRGIEFIYKEPGVNRPLKLDDDEKINLNKTRYRNQINRIGNAIKEIISGLKTEPSVLGQEKPENKEPSEEVTLVERIKGNPVKSSKRKLLTEGIVLAGLIVFAAILVYPIIFKRDALEKMKSSGERISVAVMPFHNMTNDTIWNEWQDGIQINLITYLSNYSEEIIVRQTESINGLIQSKGFSNYASITPSIASSISQKLDANIFIYGNINQVGKTIRVNAQIIDSKSKESFKSFQLDGTAENILHTIDSLSKMIKNFLIISKLGKVMTPDYQHLTTNSPDAYRYYINGEKARNKLDLPTAVNLFSQAIAIDSNFVDAIIELSGTYYSQGNYEEAKKLCLRTYKRKNEMSLMGKIYMDLNHAVLFESLEEVIKYENQILAIDDQLPVNYHDLGAFHFLLNQYNEAIAGYEKSLEIYDKWGSKPPWVFTYTGLGFAYHKTGQYKKEKKIYKKAEQDFPNNPDLIYRQTVLALTEGDTVLANQYIEKWIPIVIGQSWSEAKIVRNLADIYSEANYFDKAEKYYRKALFLEPESPLRLNVLAYFLIDNDRNNNEGLELINKALILSPDNYEYLDTKGWGLYKQGKYKDASEILQKSWDLRKQNAIYDHSAFLHLEAAKKAVASQK
jgi:tetratricopeptide (TPR) repeat protein